MTMVAQHERGLATTPARGVADARRLLTAAGAPFEMVDRHIAGRVTRCYVRAVPHLRAVFDASRAHGARDFLVYEGERLTFDDHWRGATALGHALRDRYGIGKESRIALAMRNYPEWSVIAWATIALGGVIVPLNAWETSATLAAQIADSGAALVFVDSERAVALSGLVVVPLIGVRGATADDQLEALIGEPTGYAALDPTPLPDPHLEPEDDATLFYTSGTTGSSRGVPGTHRNIATNLVNVGFRAAWAAVRRGDPLPTSVSGTAQRVQLLPLPFFHVTGFHSALVPALAQGTRLVLMRKWDADAAIDLIERVRIQALTLVPAQAIQMLDSPLLATRDLSSVEALGVGGAAAAASLAGAVRIALPRAFAGQGYGATEASSLVATNNAEDMLARPDSVGVVVPACDVRVVDEDGHTVPDGATGELQVRGPNVVRGYWNAPEATAAAFVDGWFRTGDIGCVDAEGFVYVLDRAKDIVIRGGENIHCAEVEGMLATHPRVAEVAVIGVPHRVLGEVVGAVVTLRGMAAADVAALDEHARALPAYKRPAAWFVHDGPLPRNAAGKVLKRDLNARYVGASA